MRRIQNNHCVYNMTAPYIGLKRRRLYSSDSPQGDGTGNSLNLQLQNGYDLLILPATVRELYAVIIRKISGTFAS